MRFGSAADGLLCVLSKLRPVGFKRVLITKMLGLLLVVLRLRPLLSQLCLPVCMVSGVERQTGGVIRLLFVGKKTFPVFLRELFFDNVPSVEQQGRVFLCRIKTLKKRYAGRVDAVVVSCDRWYQRFLHQDGFFVFPHLVDMVLDTSEELHQLLRGLPHSAREDVKKVIRNGFSFSISSDGSQLEMFYRDMYLPTLEKRIGETDVFVPDFVFLKYLQESGYELMMISQGGKEVCGVLFQQKDDQLVLKYAGVLNGDLALIRRGALSAFYYFFIEYAKQQKVNTVNFEGVRPFFYDGLLQYKRKWGSSLEHHWVLPEVYGVQIVHVASEPLRQFFFANPFIGVERSGGFVGYVFVDKDLSLDEKKAYEERFRLPGLQEFRFIQL